MKINDEHARPHTAALEDAASSPKAAAARLALGALAAGGAIDAHEP